MVISRKSNESVMVGGNDRCERLIKVTVLEIDGESVQLGFEVDPGVPVHRFEVWERYHNGVRRARLPEGKTALVAL
jgi:carbon storage regulator CsrA